MPNIEDNNEKVKHITETYKQKIGKIDNGIGITSYSSQELERIIRSENEKIIKAIKLNGYLGIESNNFEDVQIEYHKSEISNNKRINILTIAIMSFGMILFAIGIIGRLLGLAQDGFITIIGGAISEIVGVLIKALQTASDKSKHKYFEALIEQKRRDNIINLVKGMNEGKDKNKMIEKVIEGYFNSLLKK